MPTINEDDEDMTQEQFNKMMDNYLIQLAKQEPSEWSKDCRTYCEEKGLIKGDEKGNKMYKKFVTREELASMLDWSRGAFAAALLLLYGQEDSGNYREIAPFLAKNLTKTQIMHTIDILQKYREMCAYNVGPGHVLGALAAELEGIL